MTKITNKILFVWYAENLPTLVRIFLPYAVENVHIFLMKIPKNVEAYDRIQRTSHNPTNIFLIEKLFIQMLINANIISYSEEEQ